MNVAEKLLCLCLTAIGGTAAAAPYTVAAVAYDAHAVVLADDDGRRLRLQRGETVGSGPWRIGRITANAAVFVRDLPGRAEPLAVTVERGATIDFVALDARHGRAPEPAIVLDGRMSVQPARTR